MGLGQPKVDTTAMDLSAINSDEGNGGGPGPDLSTVAGTTSEQKKRNRIRFSCTSCREKKLKCNRQSPCDQCEKRHLADSCKFVPYFNPRPSSNGTGNQDASSTGGQSSPSHRGKAPVGESAMQARLKHLEHLVHVLKSQKRGDTTEIIPTATNQIKSSNDEPLPGLCDKKQAGVITNDRRYFEAANWESILDDITNLTNDLKTSVTEDLYDDPDYLTEQLPAANKAPVLLTGGFPYATILEMASRLPPRPAVDRLVARLLGIPEPGWIIFHVPTFLKTYDAFWDDQSRGSYTFLGLLFSMCAYAALDCERSKDLDEVPGNLGPPRQVFETFKHYSAHCLALGDYTRPGKWKVEALVLYFGCEYFQRNDSPLGCSILLSTMVRLAMHMGMHRDPKHYPDMSPFEGEMRRRVWLVVTEIDRLISFQFGLPSNVHVGISDTELPRNLHDSDFDEDTKELPPSRPETERTIALQNIVKARLMRVFGDITSALNARDGFTYSTLARLDKQLEETHKAFPAILRYRPFSQSLADPVELIMQRYWLELAYHKCRIILHRQFLARGRMDKRFEYSRKTCLDAANQLLKHQFVIHCETQQGGRLVKDRGMITSLSIYDFLLADMILCLELSFFNAKQKQPQATPDAVKAFESDTSVDIIPKEQIMGMLQTSRLIWQSMRKDSAEANKGFKILTKMLSESTGPDGIDLDSSPESTGAYSGGSLEEAIPTYPPPFHFGADTGSSIPLAALGSAGTGLTPQDTSSWPGSTGLDTSSLGQMPTAWATDPRTQAQDIIDGMVEASLTGDWSIWDTQIHKAPIEGCQIPWHSFFQANDPQ